MFDFSVLFCCSAETPLGIEPLTYKGTLSNLSCNISTPISECIFFFHPEHKHNWEHLKQEMQSERLERELQGLQLETEADQRNWCNRWPRKETGGDTLLLLAATPTFTWNLSTDGMFNAIRAQLNPFAALTWWDRHKNGGRGGDGEFQSCSIVMARSRPGLKDCCKSSVSLHLWAKTPTFTKFAHKFTKRKGISCTVNPPPPKKIFWIDNTAGKNILKKWLGLKRYF